MSTKTEAEEISKVSNVNKEIEEIQMDITEFNMSYDPIGGPFKYMRKYGISVMKIMDSKLEWSACSGEMEFDYGNNGEWAEGETPHLAIRNCLLQIQKTKIGECPNCAVKGIRNSGHLYCPRCGVHLEKFKEPNKVLL